MLRFLGVPLLCLVCVDAAFAGLRVCQSAPPRPTPYRCVSTPQGLFFFPQFMTTELPNARDFALTNTYSMLFKPSLPQWQCNPSVTSKVPHCTQAGCWDVVRLGTVWGARGGTGHGARCSMPGKQMPFGGLPSCRVIQGPWASAGPTVYSAPSNSGGTRWSPPGTPNFGLGLDGGQFRSLHQKAVP